MRLPDVLPDELLFSRLIRYCCLYAVPIPELLNCVYEDDRACINPILTTGLSSISSIFRESRDNLLREQTLAPLFMHYYPHYKEKLTAAMISKDNYAAIRLSQLSCVREHEKLTLKMCPMCVQEDIRQFGVAYWHRLHQIPGIESCHDHQQQLVHVSLPQRYRLAAGLPSLYLEMESSDSNYQSFLLARFAKQVLLKQSKTTSSISPVSYKDKLADLGYVTKAGRLRRIKLLADFYRFTSQLQHPSVSLLPASESDYKYVTNLLYNQYSQHIFKYLILGYWLSWQKVIRQEPVAKYEQAEQSPQHTEQQCVSLLLQGLSVSEISKKTGKSRTYITSVAYSAGMAHLFEPTKLKSSIRAEIIALAWKGFHRVEIARRASVSTGSVEMLISSVNGLVEWRKQCKQESKRRRYKCQILRYRQNTPLKIRKDIKRDCNAAFYWLYINEPEWLESVLPEPSQPHPNPRAKPK